MSAKKVESSFCFICLEGLNVKTERSRKEELRKKGESEFNSLMNYLLETRFKTYDSVLKDILELVGNGHATNKVGSRETQVKQLVRLCEKCEIIGAKLLELHLELEKIQMRIINEVRSVRRAVLSSSGWLGGIGKEDGSEEEGFKQFLKKFRTGVVASSKEQKELYKVLKAFQIAVTEIDGDSVHIPLVYLDKYKIAVPAENPNIFLGTVPDIVKTEPVDTESFQDALMATRSGEDCSVEINKNILGGSDTASDFYEEMCQQVGEDESSVKKQFETIPSTSSALTPDKVQISPIDVKNEFGLHLKSEKDDGEEKSLKKSNRGGRRRKKRKTARKPLKLSKKKRAELRAQQPRISKPVKDMHLIHLNIFHAGVNRTCDICGESFETKKLLLEHFGVIHNMAIEKLKCDFEGCNKSFISRNALSNHKNIHTDRFVCKVCYKRFCLKSSLQAHQRVHSQVPEKPLKCDQCPEAFRNVDVLQAHLMRDHGAPKLECKVCGKKYLYRSLLRYHMGKDHNIGATKFCTICDKNFAIASSLRHHMESFHSKGPNYVCEECGKSFLSRRRLTFHKKIHGEKTQKCPFCPKTFALKRVLTQHIRIHTGEKPYACEFCGKAFNQSQTRKAHRKICKLQSTNLTGNPTESTAAI